MLQILFSLLIFEKVVRENNIQPQEEFKLHESTIADCTIAYVDDLVLVSESHNSLRSLH